MQVLVVQLVCYRHVVSIEPLLLDTLPHSFSSLHRFLYYFFSISTCDEVFLRFCCISTSIFLRVSL